MILESHVRLHTQKMKLQSIYFILWNQKTQIFMFFTTKQLGVRGIWTTINLNAFMLIIGMITGESHIWPQQINLSALSLGPNYRTQASLDLG